MKTALVIGCILLMQQAAFASPWSKESWESKESLEYREHYPSRVPRAVPDAILVDPIPPELIPKCPNCSKEPSKPVCAMNYRLIVLFDSQCWLNLAKCRNPEIVWQTLPIEMCSRVSRPQGPVTEGVLGIAVIDDDDNTHEYNSHENSNEYNSHEAHSQEYNSWEV